MCPPMLGVSVDTLYILRLPRLQSNLKTLMIEVSLGGKAGVDTFLQI